MGRRRTGIGFGAAAALAALALGLAGDPRSARGDGAEGEAAFLAELARARAVGESGRGAEGLRVVEKALEEHAGKDYARAKRGHLEDLVRRLAFRAECPPPPPQSVVKGKLERFVSKTGEVEVRYAAGQPTDFETASSGSLVFPARFRGPFTVTIKGASYPKTTSESPTVQVGFEEDPKTRREQVFAVIFGVPPYDEGSRSVWLPAKLIQMDGETKKTHVEIATSPARRGAPYRLDVKVSGSRVSASIDGKTLGGMPKPDAVFGRLLIDAPNWSEIFVDGLVEPSWIQGKLDAIVQGKLLEFEKRFDARKHLPAWLYEAGAAPATGPKGGAPTAGPADGGFEPPEVPAAHRVGCVEVLVLLAGERDEEALAKVLEMRKEGLPDAVAGLLAARALIALERLEEALVEVEKAAAAGAPAAEALLLKGVLLLRLGREDEFEAAIRAAADAPGAPPTTFEMGTLQLLIAGRLDAARAVFEASSRRALRSTRLDALGKVVVKAQSGPDWPKTYDHRSANYHVSSDIDVDTCKQAAAVLEEALTTYRVSVKPLKAEKKRLYRVFLFAGRAGFDRYQAEVSLLGRKAENVAGLYSPILKQLLIWNLPSRDEMMRTVRHEGFHQYLDRLLPDPPVWFNEGMAVYYEAFEKVGGELRTEKPRRDLLELLAKTPPLPLSRFLALTPKEFYAGGEHSYAQAWAVVHWLKHGPGKHRDLYKALLARLETTGGREATRAVFSEESLPALDSALRAHVAAISK